MLIIFRLRINFLHPFSDAGCTVCEVDSDDVLMVPAVTACPAGYEMLYTGWLASSYRDHSKPFTPVPLKLFLVLLVVLVTTKHQPLFRSGLR